jgi:uncharacterized membrane protein HdeD (DUF308 family)
MTAYPTTPGLPPSTWVRILLGAVLIVAGLFVVSDITLATFISTILIAVTAIVAGGFEIIHACWTKGWGGLTWHILLGTLYIAFGIVLLTQPGSNILIVTYVLGLLLAISGFVRILLCVSHWKDAGWIMLLSGTFGILAGLVILTGFPMAGLWVLGLLLGIDLVGHGIAWLTYGWPLSAIRTP